MNLNIIRENKFVFFTLAFFALNIFNYGSFAFLVLLIVGQFFLKGRFAKGTCVNYSFILFFAVLLSTDIYHITWAIKMVIVSLSAGIVLRYGDNFEKIRTVIIFTIIFFAFQLLSSYAYNMSIGMITGREYISLCTMSVLSATAFANLIIPLASLICYVIVTFNKVTLINKCLFFILCILCVNANLWLAGRTFFGATIITIILSLIYAILNSNDNRFKYSILKGILLLVLFGGTIFLIAGNELTEIIETSNFYMRFNSGYEDYATTTRTDNRHLFYITHLFDSLWGGGNIRAQLSGARSHTLFLDCSDMCGIPAMIVLISMIIFSLKLLYKFCRKSSNLFIEDKVLLFSFYLVLNIAFLLEPIIEGSQWAILYYWFITCLLYGFLIKNQI